MRVSSKTKLLLLAFVLVGGFAVGVFNLVIVPILKMHETYEEISGGIRGQNYEAH